MNVEPLNLSQSDKDKINKLIEQLAKQGLTNNQAYNAIIATLKTFKK